VLLKLLQILWLIFSPFIRLWKENVGLCPNLRAAMIRKHVKEA
jgi:hypothetical protein